MNQQETQKTPKFNIWRTIVTITVLAILAFGGYNTGYDDGYDEGHDAGYEVGYDEGYSEGYDDAEQELGENDLSGYLGPAPDTSSYLTTDTAPAGTVWTTPAGEKYHEGWCRYIDGRHDLTYYLSATDAINAGYSPCSVCH